MNFYIPSENDLIRSTVDSHQRSHNQLEITEDGKNGFPKTFLKLSGV
jgi:hypothetical protein